MDLATALTALRSERNLTQEQAGARIGVAPRMWRRWEAGHTRPSDRYRRAIERTFDVQLPGRPMRPDVDITSPAPPPLPDETLAEYVRAAMTARGITATSVLASRCRIAWSTAAGILDGTLRAPGDRTLAKVADGLGVPLHVLRGLAAAVVGTPWTPPAGTERLTEAQRLLLDQLVSELVRLSPPLPISGARNGDGPDTEASGPA